MSDDIIVCRVSNFSILTALVLLPLSLCVFTYSSQSIQMDPILANKQDPVYVVLAAPLA